MPGVGVFVGGVAQHVGKTSVCAGLSIGGRALRARVAYYKPFGPIEDVDTKLLASHFGVTTRAGGSDALPLARFGPGRRPGTVRTRESARILERMGRAYRRLLDSHDFVVVEGSGHMGVGSVAGMSNARIAATLGAPVLLVANGGVGKPFDELALSLAFCASARWRHKRDKDE